MDADFSNSFTIILHNKCNFSTFRFFVCSNADVEPQYSGARIEGDVVTLDFVKKMIEDFKSQKCLHKRYVWRQ